MHGALNAAARLVADARARHDRVLPEADAFRLLESAGIRCPRRLFVRTAAEVGALTPGLLSTPTVVVKVVSPVIAHKSDVGGVRFVDNDRAAIAETVDQMARAFAAQGFAGCSISEFVEHDSAPGGEWLLGLRWTDEFGPVLTVGAGGVATEFLAAALAPGRDVAVFSPGNWTTGELEVRLQRLAWTPLLTGAVRRQPPRASLDELSATIERFSVLADLCGPDGLSAIEINPLVAGGGRLVAVDVLATIGDRASVPALPRPVHKLANLLKPASIAVVGVSERMNPGHIILTNLLREGADRASLFVVKPDGTAIEGCTTVRSIAALPQRVDLLILAIAAAQVPQAIVDVVTHQKAESVIVIPGGLEEKAGTEALITSVRDTVRAARATPWQGPVLNGGNCLGILSRPGHYDTMFIPPYKLGTTIGAASPVALISQSGAFAVSRATELAGVRPMYSITVGNQMDLTIGDYLTYLEQDADLKVFGVYVEGFKAGDGRVALDAIDRITRSGRTVILYRAGRTPAGALATASHTASIAGDYTVTRELADAAGAIVADTLDDFTDLIALFTQLLPRPVGGTRIGAVSNAGYECVAIADRLGALQLPPFTAATCERLRSLFDVVRVGTIVDVHNPLDLTPMLDDSGYETAVRRVLEDDNVDVALVGCVPVTPAVNTLAASAEHGEDLMRYDSLASRLIRLKEESTKPWVAVIDAGPLYDALAGRLQRAGIPTFRAADRAMRLLNVFVAERLRDAGRRERCWVDEFALPVQ